MTTPLRPEPDAKDWTWVLDRPCPECGFDAPSLAGTDVPARVRTAVAALGTAVQAPGSDVRPAPEVWSALEYGCHVRDVCIVFGTRLAQMRHSDDPQFPDWNQDETALAERYWEQIPAQVADELAIEGERIAGDFVTVTEDEWCRPGRRSNGSRFTVETLAKYFLHDLVHHVHDVVGRQHPEQPPG